MNKEEIKNVYRKLRRITKFIKSIESTPLSIKKAARYTGLSKSHLYKLTHQQLIPHYKPKGKLIYFLKRDLDNYLLQNRISTSEEITAKAKRHSNILLKKV